MTPAQHATAATTDLATTTPGSHIEREILADRAQVHAILASKAGTGTNYTTAEQLLSDALNPNSERRVVLRRALAYAHLAD